MIISKNINLASAYPKIMLEMLPKHGFRTIELLFILALLLLIGVGLKQYWQLDELGERAVQKTMQLQSKTKRSKPIDLNISEQEKTALNEAFLKLNYSWDRPFKALEKAKMPDVSVLEIQPEIARQEFLVVAQTTTLQKMLEYTKKLREQPFVSRVVLNSEESQADQSQAVLFSLTFKWY